MVFDEFPIPRIDAEKCTGEQDCYEVCPVQPNVFELNEEDEGPAGARAWVLYAEECITCMACETACPTLAIVVE